ncbi:hypothetical protein K2173_002584 [Erythroxylum novogranatense]|uniref:DUF4218 domain-containing protein n=1 Tax=Erythroxylum novogranatense TaxID=1862640 RepID=A0AAV8TTV8_9ROSI|nr:hypothetical protein K2173_002584 [Erythroxylum novogranatense]
MYYFPLTPRLQRLYTSDVTACHMRWHAEHDQEDGVMRHPSDALAWKHFNDTHVHFAIESRNMRLGLSTDGFQPFGQSGQQYSSWPVIITPYNLPPWMCMKKAYITAGKLAYPHCGNDSDAFYLPTDGKISWFDNHRKFLPPDHPFRRNKYKFIKNRIVKQSPPPLKCGVEILQEIEALGLLKVTEIDADEVNRSISQNFGWRKRSIFWDLPYWKTNMVRHNLDVMHIEKNMFDNLFNTIMNIEGGTKDNAKSRANLQLLCRRHELHKDVRTGKYPKACYTLGKQQKERLCEWLKGLKFPDGYVSNLSRCVDMRKYKLFGMKSHDCHVFMQRLIPIAFRELLPSKVWEPLTELSWFFKSLTSSEINFHELQKLENEISVILCKLEGIFPPSLFDCMEHLPVHLPHEEKLAGPVQYRWMYPFERYLHHLKKNVKNKARVEGSICNAYLVEEASTFCGHYFEPHVRTRARQVPHNDDGGGTSGADGNLSIFTYPGRTSRRAIRRMLTDEEIDAAHEYILLNCQEILPFEAENPIQNKFISDLAKGPL